MRIGSLFSGYGGLDMAVAQVLGGTVAWHVEFDKAPSRILEHRYPDVPNYGDVTAVDFTTIEPVDVLTGGYPCQPFSHAGLRKGTNDERHLWPHVLRAIREMGPRLVVLENVRGHLTLGFDAVLADLASVGWSARWGVVRASDAGACHQRARLFILAYPERNGRDQGWPESAGLKGRPDAPQRRDGILAYASSGQQPRFTSTWDGLLVPPKRGSGSAEHSAGATGGQQSYTGQGPRFSRGADCEPTADSSGQRHGRGQDAGVVGRLGAPSDVIGWEAGAAREIAGDRGPTDAANARGVGRKRRSSVVGVGRQQAIGGQESDHPGDGPIAWGDYGPAIARWEHVIGRPAPRPTEPGRTGQPRLAPRFVEWMMGLPDGHVTNPAIGISRNDQLKALGNGVVPQQAALALSLLLPRIGEVAA